ncbi:MAG: archaellin/type IV pilin N-terminal domain-containing protein [Candidatus Bathyarchaeia archaeon]
MGKRFTNRGISTIIAALLLIAIAIAAGVLLYVFSIGLIGSLQGSGGQQTKDQVIMEAYQWLSTTPLTLNLRNTGATTLDMTKATFYVGGVLMAAGTMAGIGGGAGCAAATFGPGCYGAQPVTISSLTPTNGVAYVVKIALADGGVMSYSAVFGTSA